MASIVDYETVLRTMRGLGLESQYYNSGAFGFAAPTEHSYAGWIGPADATIRAEALTRTRTVPAPHEATLARLAVRFRQQHLPGRVWIMPKANWAYELDFGSKTWLPEALERAGIAAAHLAGKTNAPALEFVGDEDEPLEALVRALLEKLVGSDFAMAFPEQPIVCTIHHHKQLWWVSSDRALIETALSQTETRRFELP